MVYLLISIVILSLWDVKKMKDKNQKKDIVIYSLLMVMVGTLGVYYFSVPDHDSFSKILLSFIGQGE